MRLPITKKSIAAVLLGIVFLLGGAMTVLADAAATDAAAAKESEDAVMAQLNCGVGLSKNDAGVRSSLEACIPVYTYYLFYKPASWLMVGGAFVFDAILTLSIDSKFILQPFIDTSWKVVRDFSNMAFIFILLYTGISTMLGSGNWRKTVLNVIVIALLINFSLFFTKVVIDAGNILAVGIYSAMGDLKTGSDIHITGGTDRLEERNISFALTRSFQPQSFMKVAGSVTPLDAVIVFIIAGIVSVFAGYIFFKAALVFIGRLIGFWFLMIISPFAFISITFPKGNKFQEWLDALLNQAFVAPVFLFFIYLIMKVVNSHILDSLTKDPTPEDGLKAFAFQKVLLPVIIATLLIMALKFALEYAEKMAGDFGKLGAKIGGTALGLAGGAALGATALGGRALGGRIAQSLQEKGTFQKMATGDTALGRFAGRQMLGLNEKARTGTWDARGTGLGQKGMKTLGVDLGKPSAGAKGGFEGAQKRQEQADLKFAKKLEMTEDEKEAINAKYDVAAKEGEREKQQKNVAEYVERVKAVEEERRQAETEAQNSAEGIVLAAMQNQLKSQTEAAQKATTEREAAQNAISGAIDVAGAQKALSDAILKETQARGAVTTTQTLVDKANTDFTTVVGQKISLADQKLKATQTDLEVAQGNAKVAADNAKKATGAAKLEIDTESKRRRESYADYVEGRAKTAFTVGGGAGAVVGMMAGPVGAGVAAGAMGYAAGAGMYGHTYSHTQAKRTAAKLRKGGDAAKPKEEETALEKAFKEAVDKKIKEKSHAEPAGGKDTHAAPAGKKDTHEAPHEAHATPAPKKEAAHAAPAAAAHDDHGGGHH